MASCDPVALASLVKTSERLTMLKLSNMKHLPFDFIWPWSQYLTKIGKANPPLEQIDLSSFSNEL